MKYSSWIAPVMGQNCIEFLKHGTVLIVIANLKYLSWKGNGMKCEIKKDRIMSGWSEIGNL